MIHETSHMMTELNKYVHHARGQSEMRQEEMKRKVKLEVPELIQKASEFYTELDQEKYLDIDQDIEAMLEIINANEATDNRLCSRK